MLTLGGGTQPGCKDAVTPLEGGCGGDTLDSPPFTFSPFVLLTKSNMKPKKAPIQIRKDEGQRGGWGKGGGAVGLASFPRGNRSHVP